MDKYDNTFDYGICYKHQVVSNGTYTVNLPTRYNRKEE